MSSARRKWVQIFAICTPIIVLYAFTASIAVQDENSIRLPPPTKPISKKNITNSPPTQSFQTSRSPSDLCSTTTTTNITIIPWNSYWIWPDYGIGVQNTGFLEHNCPCTNCFLSLDKSKVDKADVVLIHGHELGGILKEDLINLKKRRTSRKNGWPLILYWNKESPKGVGPFVGPPYEELLNLTFTYRSDSTISNAFGRLKPVSQEAKAAFQKGQWLQKPNTDTETEIKYQIGLEDRTKEIAWMVSHCKTDSNREGIVSHLREISDLKIDIFGKCGDREHRLPKQKSNSIGETMRNRGKVYKDVLKKYKFYLSFENALCQDYITEKFFLAMYAGALPIVYGGLSKGDYEKIAPENSFIHVDDYDTMEDLSNHLTYLSNNIEAYNSYFWWRQHYKVLDAYETQWDNFCNLCQVLNNCKNGILDTKIEAQKYNNLHSYWDAPGICRPPNERLL